MILANRFVNCIVDQEQQGFYAQSIAIKAEQIGMPSWLVELRHASTHEALPAISVLRTACRQALDWLYGNYWKIQTDIHNGAFLTNIAMELRPLLCTYMDQRRMYLKLKSSKKSGKQMPRGKKLAKRSDFEFTDNNLEAGSSSSGSLEKFDPQKPLKHIRHIISTIHQDLVSTVLIPILLKPGFLVPEDKKYRSRLPDCRLDTNVLLMWKQAFREFEAAWGPGMFIQDLLTEIILAFEPDLENPAASTVINTKAGAISSSYASTLGKQEINFYSY